MTNKKEVQDDYDFTRSMYYNLAEKGQEGIDLLLDLARESEHPRAFEVLSNSIRQNADVVEKLMKLQKDKERRLGGTCFARPPQSPVISKEA